MPENIEVFMTRGFSLFLLSERRGLVQCQTGATSSAEIVAQICANIRNLACEKRSWVSEFTFFLNLVSFRQPFLSPNAGKRSQAVLALAGNYPANVTLSLEVH